MQTKTIAMLIAVLGVQYSTNVYAVDKWSRACRFDTVPTAWKYPAVKFMRFMEPKQSIRDLHLLPSAEQREIWINESLTTDYFSVRYYLFAKAAVYIRTSDMTWTLHKVFASKWSAEEVLEGIRNDPDLRPFYVNRGPTPFYSARAGAPALHERYAEYNYNNIRTEFRVNGYHAYYDGTLKKMYDMGTTSATDCNLSQWGQHGLFDR